jgi:transposase
VARTAGRIMKPKSPEMIEVNARQLEELLRRAEGKLDAQDYELMQAIFQSYTYVTDLVEDKNTSIRRLRQLLFGARTEKTDAVVGGGQDASDDDPARDATDIERPCDPSQEEDESLAGDSDEADTTPAQGHGRHGADAYRGAEQIDVSHESLQAGDACPQCGQGKVYEVARPGVLVRVVGQAPLHAKVYHLQKLRCHLCGKVFTAGPPEDAGARKYDAMAGSMIALLKYGSGMPFNRVAGLQRNMEIPLPASTQWDVIAAYAPAAVPAYEALISQAAQGDVLYNDDTTVKILEFMGERAKKQPLDDDAMPGRTGLFTSGVVSTREGCRLALFFSGRQHAGENLADVLQRRAEQLQRPIQMCDALSRNLPGELETIVAHCMAHGRRRFVDVVDRFPDECRYVLEALKIVYRTDAEARKRKLSPTQRLGLHRTKSRQTMTRLHRWLKRQFDEKLVEPNSALGEAINYMLKHWEKLTRFLHVPGAPLDNNICERALKKAILHRKNALFYKTQRGARIGDMYMSLIYTCELGDVSPFKYLTELHRNADQVAAAPDSWLPWNYQASVETNRVLVDA